MIKKAGDCRNNTLSLIYGQFAELRACEKQVKKHLTEKMAQHCKVTDTRNQTITLTADNPGILSLLRYQKSELLQKLRTEEKMYALRSINLLLAAPHFRTSHAHRQMLVKSTIPTLSAKSYESIHTMASECQHDPLKTALEKLEETLRQKVFSMGDKNEKT